MTDSSLQINGPNLIRLPCENTNRTFLDGFWKWVEILAAGNYVQAIESLYWEREPWKPEEHERLIKVINDKSEIEWQQTGGWARALISVTNKPECSKEDDVPLMGLATSFFIRRFGNNY